MTIIAIGWDVRGWRGNQQAVAVLKLNRARGDFKWWVSNDFQFQTDEPLSLSSLLIPTLGDNFEEYLAGAEQVVLGIDAPLAFSQAFTKLLTDHDSEYLPTNNQMGNPLAYRDCERWIKEQHLKTPLSASFDKLGNGATLAISLTHKLRKEGFSLIPQDGMNTTKSIIEVYPGIVKTGSRREMPAIGPVHKHIPDYVIPGTDQYDAAICALMAAVFSGASNQLKLPEIVKFQPEFDPREGWIYGLPANYVSQYQL